MKTCTYCGCQSDDAATACALCGTDLSAIDSAKEEGRIVPVYLDPIARFRILVALSTICYLLLLIGPWVFWRGLSQDTYDGLAWRGFGAVLPISPTAYYIMAVVWLAAAIGVYFFVPAALWVYTALIVFNIITTLLGGMQTALAVQSFLLYLTNLADGAILVLAYWTPLRKNFTQPAIEPFEEEPREPNDLDEPV